jgi:hypothetical protein
MKIINFRMLAIKVTSYSAIDNKVSLEIEFDDGKRKQVFRTTPLDTPEEEAGRIVDELVLMETNINKSFTGKSLQGEIHMVFGQEEEARQRITSYLKLLASKAAKVKLNRDPHIYLNNISELIRTRLDFEDPKKTQ